MNSKKILVVGGLISSKIEELHETLRKLATLKDSNTELTTVEQIPEIIQRRLEILEKREKIQRDILEQLHESMFKITVIPPQYHGRKKDNERMSSSFKKAKKR